MNNECKEVRERLTSTRGSGMEAHLDDCPSCRRYAARLQEARSYFEAHHGGAEPDPVFALRVAERLNGRPVAALGWAAWRLIPASLVLALVLAWFAFQAAPPYVESSDTLAPTEDLIGWLLEDPGDGQ